MISTVDPKKLLDQHLFDEWNSIPLVVAMFRDDPERGVLFETWSPEQSRRAFFTTEDRIRWLVIRAAGVYGEMLARGFAKRPGEPLKMPVGYDTFGPVWFPSWEEDEAGCAALMAAQHKDPGRFKFRGEPAQYYHYKGASL
jgi:hypothetical protein